jgi:hypothetical protein
MLDFNREFPRHIMWNFSEKSKIGYEVRITRIGEFMHRYVWELIGSEICTD